MVRLLNNNRIITSLLSVLLLVCGILISYDTSNILAKEQSLFLSGLLSFISKSEVMNVVVLSMVILSAVMQLFVYNMPLNTNKLFEKKSYLSFFVFALIFLLTINLSTTSNIIIGTFIFSFSYLIVTSIGDAKNGIKTAFNCGLLIGCAGLINTSLLLLLPIVFIGLLYQRKFYWREWVASIVGLLLPFLFWFAVHAESVVILKNLFHPDLLLSVSFLPSQLITICVIAFIVVISIPSFLKKLQLSTVNEKKRIYLLVWMAIIGVIAGIITGILFLLVFMFIPMITFSMTNFLLSIKRKWIADLLMFVFIAAIVYNQLKEYWQI